MMKTAEMQELFCEKQTKEFFKKLVGRGLRPNSWNPETGAKPNSYISLWHTCMRKSANKYVLEYENRDVRAPVGLVHFAEIRNPNV